MTQLSQTPQKRPRRISPTPSLSSQEIAQRKTEREELAVRCRVIFERLRSELRENHDNWFIAIHADSENYLLAPTLEGLVQKIRHNYPEEAERQLTIFCLNETGTCGRL